MFMKKRKTQDIVIQSSTKHGGTYEPVRLPYHTPSAMNPNIPELDPAYSERQRLESLEIQENPGNQNIIVVDINAADEGHN